MVQGWTAMAAGRLADAQAAADEILRRTPWDHGAIVLKISAASRSSALTGLDAYETWLESRRTEDVSLLEPVAHATMTALAAVEDRGLRIAALEQLARHGDTAARKQLATLATMTPAMLGADAALARLGDAAATARLQKVGPSEGRYDPTALADALADTGPASIPTLLSLLETGRGPGRAAAATALGRLHATSATDALRRATADPEPLLSISATVALARLGDADARPRVEGLLSSNVADVRLLAAEAWEGRAGPWVEAVRPLLNDPMGLVRLQAARLIAPVDPDAAAATLGRATQDDNPVVRAAATRIVEERAEKGVLLLDLPTLRRLLRDPDSAIRLSAASALLAHVRARK